MKVENSSTVGPEPGGKRSKARGEPYPAMRESIPGAYVTLKPSMLKHEPTIGALTEAWHGWLWSAGINPGGSLEEVSTRSQKPEARG